MLQGISDRNANVAEGRYIASRIAGARYVVWAPSLFRGEFRPFCKPEHMAMLLDSLRKAALAS